MIHYQSWEVYFSLDKNVGTNMIENNYKKTSIFLQNLLQSGSQDMD